MGPIPKSSFIGVSWRSKEKKWKAQIGDRNGKSKYLGVYDTDIDAARAVNRFCIKNNLSIRNPTILSVLSDPKNEPQIKKLVSFFFFLRFYDFEKQMHKLRSQVYEIL